MSSDTIFALATAAGRAGIAVFRISGPRAGAVLESLTGRGLPPPRVAARRRLFSCDESGARLAIDDSLVIHFPAPASFTGEDVAELHVHGGPAIIAATAAALGKAGLRLAEPGEFTRRAFDHGKLDLVEIEGLADLIAAETEAQRRQALRQAEGALSALYENWRGTLISALARLEAAIDFPDEDLPAGLMALVDGAMREAAAGIHRHLADDRRGERLREGYAVAIIGAPNVGKSSLLNRLARRDAAIVSARAGTTRDVIEVKLDLDGYPVQMSDTAGLRESSDEIEQEGMRRALAQAAHADLLLVVFDASLWPALDPVSLEQLAAPGRPHPNRIDGDAIVVLNKADCATLPERPEIAGRPAFAVSAATGVGLDSLVAAVTARAAAALSPGAQPALTRLRHRSALEACAEALDRGAEARVMELKAEDLRLAVQALGRITGRVDVEDVLDMIFREFCIGK